jgi:hypothetical protein
VKDRALLIRMRVIALDRVRFRGSRLSRDGMTKGHKSEILRQISARARLSKRLSIASDREAWNAKERQRRAQDGEKRRTAERRYRTANRDQILARARKRDRERRNSITAAEWSRIAAAVESKTKRKRNRK